MSFVKDDKKSISLNIALYGLKESPSAWYECFDTYMREQGFQKCEYDYCFYFKVDNDESIILFILLFVDDILICFKDKEKITKEKLKLSNIFKMKNTSRVNSYV